MSAQHTPKQWRAGPVFQKDGLAIFFTDNSRPGRWQARLDDKTGVFHADDARLIAAAPAMLGLLIELREVLSSDRNGFRESVANPITDEIDEASDRQWLADMDAQLLRVDATIKAAGGV